MEKDDADEAETAFKPEDIRVGTELEIRGEYNETTGELQAQSIKVFLAETKKIKRTALIEKAPDISRRADGWNGVFYADGQRIKVNAATQILLKPNKSEKKSLKKTANKATSKPSGSNEAKEETADAEEVLPLKSLDQVGTNVFMAYEGFRGPDGMIVASKLVFTRNELEESEAKFWKQTEFQQKEPNYASLKPGELKLKSIGKFKLVPNLEAQQYVQNLGARLVPRFPGAAPIPFKFFLAEDKQPNAFATANGIVVVHSSMFELLENEDQLAAVMGHEIAHSVQEHTWRQHEYHKKKLTALKIGGMFAAGMGYGGIGDIAKLVEAAVRNGYSRSLENQADRVGLDYMIAAGYDPREAARVWKIMGQKLGDHPTNLFWSSHDNHTQRRSYLMAEMKNNHADLDFAALRPKTAEFNRISSLVKESVSHKQRLKVK